MFEKKKIKTKQTAHPVFFRLMIDVIKQTVKKLYVAATSSPLPLNLLRR